MHGTTQGFTLVELLITVTTLGILSSLAVSNLNHLQQSQQLRSASQSLWSHLLLARTEAVKRHSPIIVVATGGHWTAGWRMFPDLNRNGIQDANEAVLQQYQALPAGVVVTGNATVRSYIRYTPDGRTKLLGGAFQAGTLSICHSNNEHPVRQLIISATGRVRESRTTASACP